SLPLGSIAIQLFPQGRPWRHRVYSGPAMAHPCALDLHLLLYAILEGFAMSQCAPIRPQRSAEIETALPFCSPAVRDALDRVRSGEELSFDSAFVLAQATSVELAAIVAVADHLRRESVGDTITYVVNRNINFTNICFVGCSFCGFARGAQAPDAYTHST